MAASLPADASVRPQALIVSFASGDEVASLRLATEHEQVRGAEAVVRSHRQRHGRVHARQLFDADAVFDRRESRATA
jgi:hypothetical protein